MRNVFYIIIIFLSILLTGCGKDDETDAVNIAASDPSLLSFTFRSEDNPDVLLEDIVCSIDSNKIECWIPYVIMEKELIPCISYVGDRCKLGGQEFVDGNLFDFSCPVELEIISMGGQKHIKYMFTHLLDFRKYGFQQKRILPLKVKSHTLMQILKL